MTSGQGRKKVSKKERKYGKQGSKDWRTEEEKKHTSKSVGE